MAETPEENGALTDDTSAIEDGKILDYITGKPVAQRALSLGKEWT